MLAVGVFTSQALERNQVLDQAAILIRARIFLQEFLPRLKLVSQTTDNVSSIDGTIDLASISDHSQELISESLLRFSKLLEAFSHPVIRLMLWALTLNALQILVDIFDVDSDMTDAKHDKSAVGFDPKMTSLLKFVIQTEQPIASDIKMARILVDVEAD